MTDPKDNARRPDNRFAEVLREELDSVVRRREAMRRLSATDAEELDPGHENQSEDHDLRTQRKRALRMSLFGVAFSGGGIRSATINLGVLQALGHLKLLRYVDYLSTVSGGGYVGGWLAAWIRRETDSEDLKSDPSITDAARAVEAVRNVEKQLDPDHLAEARSRRHGVKSDQFQVFDQEPTPIRHLRTFSRYLAPQWGPFSIDTWTLLAIYIRNLFINLLILLPWLATIVLVCRLMVCWTEVQFTGPVIHPLEWFFMVLFFLLLFTPFDRIARELDNLRSRKNETPTTNMAGWLQSIQIGIPLSFLMAGVIGQVVLRDFGPRLIDHFSIYINAPWLIQSVDRVPSPILTGLFFTMILAVQYLIRGRGLHLQWRIVLLDTLLAFVFGILLQLVVDGMAQMPARLEHYSDLLDTWALSVALKTAFGPPLFLLALMVPSYLVVALAGHALSEYEREWRSRLASLMLLWSAAWIAIFSMVILLPSVFMNFGSLLGYIFGSKPVHVPTPPSNLTLYRLGSGQGNLVGRVGFFSGWVGTILIGFSLMRPRVQKRWGTLLQTAALLLYILFQSGLITIVSVIIDQLADLRQKSPASTDFYQRVLLSSPAMALGVGLASGLIAFWMSNNIPMSLFSLHSLYGNRLTRCYLGASLNADGTPDQPATNLHSAAPTGITQTRHSNPFTGLDPADDMPLARLRVMDRMKNDQNEYEEEIPPYFGPYPLFNATLNLIGGAGGNAHRKAESFVLTPSWCGGDSTGFAKLSRDKKKVLENLTLGRAITISGAAVDPNMNILQSPQLTAFLTLINARLGAWISNPAKAHPAEEWEASSPYGAGSFFRELFGLTDARQDHVHLSDGGHFENSGAYELIRRRCRYVVMVDAAEDPEDASENLANLIRLVRRDFGIRIEIDTTPLHKNQQGFSLWHTAVGTIRYDEVDPEGVIGTLIFVRSSLTGDEPADILNYARKKPEFPHHPTMNQFFDEDQFESYRGLGFHIGTTVFSEAARVLHDTSVSRSHVERLRRFFADLRRNWSPLAADAYQGYHSSCSNYMQIVGSMRDLPAMRRMSMKIYPEIAALMTHSPEFRTTQSSTGDPLAGQFVELFEKQLEEARERTISELHGVDYLLQFLEIAWIENQFDRYFAHPINRGWMTVMRRWTDSEPFHRAWPILRSQYSRGFVQFCERVLNLGEPPAQWCPITDPCQRPFQDILNAFDHEFQREWAHLTKTEGENIANRPLIDLSHYLQRAVRFSRMMKTQAFEPDCRTEGIPASVSQKHSAIETDLNSVTLSHPYMAWALTWGLPSESPGEISADDENANWSFVTAEELTDISLVNSSSKIRKFPIGLVVAFPSSDHGPEFSEIEGENAFLELVVWIRGPYRSMGLGRDSLPRLLREHLTRENLTRHFGRPFDHVFTRYPKTSLYTGERVQQAQWMSFFFDQGFVVHFDPQAPWSQRELRLKRKLS